MRPRILVLAPDAFGTGGIERSTRTLLSVLGERTGADRVGIVSVWGGRANLPSRVLHRGPPHGLRPQVPFAAKIAFVLAATRSAWACRTRLVVVCCHPHLAPVAVGVARLARAPVAVWCHGDEVWRPLRPTVRWALRRADRVFAPSRFTADQVVGWADLQREVVVVPHGVPRELTPGRPAPIPGRVLAVARLEPHDRYKGVATLIRSWPRVLATEPEAELVIVGDGADRARLESLAGENGAVGRIRFTGRIDDPQLKELYRTAAVFALPAAATIGRQAGGEGFGLVFLEAAAAGLPVVAGRAGAVPEVVEDGVTGLLVEPRDPAAVADAIVALLSDEELRSRMGRAGHSRARSLFSYQAFGDGIASMLGDLVPAFTPGA